MVIAVITGASSGLGKEYINAVIEQFPMVEGFWLVARRKELLKEIAEAHPDKTIAAISLDLSQQESLEIFEKLLKEGNPEIKVLINNAGYGKGGDFFSSNRESQAGMVDLNCRALTAITEICLPFMRKGSRIINLASAAAFCPQPSFAVYAATKAYVLSFSRALHMELKSKGIYVTAVCPGPVKTEFFRVSGELTGKLKKLTAAGAQAVVRKALQDSLAKKQLSVYGPPMKAARAGAKLLPHSLIMKLYV